MSRCELVKVYCLCVRAAVCDNDRLSAHSNVEPRPALILIHYLYFPLLAHTHTQLRDGANRIQHMYAAHSAVKGDGACGEVSFTGQCLILTSPNEPLHYTTKNMTECRDGNKLDQVILQFNDSDKHTDSFLLQKYP